MGRTARGVRGIRLSDDDEVVGAVAGNAEDNSKLLTITERGFGKRSEFEEFRAMKNRGGSGVACHKISEKTGALVSIVAVSEEDDIMLMTGDGTMIRMAVAEIPTYSRTAGGVIVMRLSEGDSVCGFAKIASEEKAEAEALAKSEEDEAEEIASAVAEEISEDTPEEDTAEENE
jgi:DNA gyrase subunit A